VGFGYEAYLAARLPGCPELCAPWLTLYQSLRDDSPASNAFKAWQYRDRIASERDQECNKDVHRNQPGRSSLSIQTDKDFPGGVKFRSATPKVLSAASA